ncbi:MAG: ATP-binding protein [Dongiaceae bacterium]
MEQEPLILGHIVSVAGSRAAGVLMHPGSAKGASEAFQHASQLGAIVKIITPRSLVFGIVNSLSIPKPSNPPSAKDQRYIELELFGEALLGPATVGGFNQLNFQRGVSVFPALGQPILATTHDDLAQIYAVPAASNVRVGAIFQDTTLPAHVVTDRLLGQHFAVLGNSGAGKSCSVALILNAVLNAHPNGHVLLLDPHNEYPVAFNGAAEIINTQNLQLPYWLMNFEEARACMVSHAGTSWESEIAILKEAMLEAKQRYAGEEGDISYITIDTPVPYRLSDVIRFIDEAAGRLNKADNSAPFLRLKARIETLRDDPRFAFMFGGTIVRDSMAEILSRLLRIPVKGRPITIVDLSGVPSEIIDVVVSVLVRMIFDFAVWTERTAAVPTLLVCEEAHRYIPRDEKAGFAPTRKAIAQIAKEGRKYGVSLCLVSQRPSELSETILSQCNTIFALRLGNDHDQNFVARALPESARGFLASLPALRTQEAIVVGEGVTLPMRILFDNLPSDGRPRSETLPFSSAWQNDTGGDGIVAQTVHRWRRQVRR